jgi:hypothetical protein
VTCADRTWEYVPVRHVYQKLGISRRTQLASMLDAPAAQTPQ